MLYTCCDVTQTWLKYLRERDVGRSEKQKRKIYSFSFSFFRAKPISLQLVLQIHLYTYVLRVCAVCYAEGRDIPTLSRIRSSTEKTSFIERYSFARKNSFSLMASGTRIISFLYLICEASTVLRKSKLFPHERAVLSRNLLHAAAVSQCYPLRIIVCR